MKTVIVGSGISGLALGILLAREGREVFIYDKRTVFDEQTDGRSINFTISGRGLAVLEKLKLKEIVLARSTVLVGRILHLPKEKKVHYKYGTKKSQVLLSIRRSELLDILLSAAAQENSIHLYSGFELINIEEKTLTCHFLNSANQENAFVKADVIVGADGVFSPVRSFMLKKQIASYQQTVFNWGYKEYQFDHEDAEKLQLSTDHMHMWPKSNALLVAIPNTDKTFSVIFTAPLKDPTGAFNNFDDLVKKECRDVVNRSPSFLKKCGEDPYNYLISVKVDKWHMDDKVVLIGDACHATYPFYGQGMNSALEDAVILSDYMNNQSLSTLEAFSAYETHRKKDTDALHQLSEGHLNQMTKAMISPFFRACHLLDYQFAKLLPNRWVYEYELVAHSSLSYSKVLNVVKKQNNKKRINGFFLMAITLGFFLLQRDAISRFLYRKNAQVVDL